MKTHVYYCGEAADTRLPDGVGALVSDKTQAQSSHFSIELDPFHTVLAATFEPTIADLHLVASYVAAADMSVRRGRRDAKDDKGWRRAFRLRIPVTNPDLWRDKAIVQHLTDSLYFLSEDRFEFEFVKAARTDHVSRQMNFAGGDGQPWGVGQAGAVMMFSGGIDSTAGLLELAEAGVRTPVLVTHETSPTLTRIRRELIQGAKEIFPGLAPMGVSIGFKKIDASLDREPSNRTRTLMYVALGAAALHWTGQDRLLMYENGTVAMNLPILPQLVGTQATRTAHPQALIALGRLVSKLLDRTIKIENPWVFKTRGEVMMRLKACGGIELLKTTVSCAHVHQYLVPPYQCGTCSQCVDRRCAAAAMGLSEYDPASLYQHDFRVGRPVTAADANGENPGTKPAYDRTVAVAMIETALRHRRVRNRSDLLVEEAEANRVLQDVRGAVLGDPETVAEAVAALHRHHGEEVLRATAIWREDFGVKGASQSHPNAAYHLTSQSNASEDRGVSADLASTRKFICDEKKLILAFPGDREGWVPNNREGFQCIRFLLANPGDRFTPLQVLKAAGLADEAVPEARSLGLRVDRKAMHRARKEADDLQQRANRARLAGLLDEAAEFEREAARIAPELNKNTRPGGKIKDENPAAERQRKRLYSLVATARDSLAGQFPELAAHLKKHIVVSGTATRYGYSGPKWRTMKSG